MNMIIKCVARYLFENVNCCKLFVNSKIVVGWLSIEYLPSVKQLGWAFSRGCNSETKSYPTKPITTNFSSINAWSAVFLQSTRYTRYTIQLIIFTAPSFLNDKISQEDSCFNFEGHQVTSRASRQQ